jgi:hypothetical protein
MSSLVLLCLSSYYQSDVLPHYEPVPPRNSVGYVQTISNDITQASPRLVPPNLSISRLCHGARALRYWNHPLLVQWSYRWFGLDKSGIVNIGVLVFIFRTPWPGLTTLFFPVCPDCCRYSSWASNQWAGTFAQRETKKNTCFLCCKATNVSSHPILHASNEFLMWCFLSSFDSHGSYSTVSLGV